MGSSNPETGVLSDNCVYSLERLHLWSVYTYSSDPRGLSTAPKRVLEELLHPRQGIAKNPDSQHGTTFLSFTWLRGSSAFNPLL